MFKIPEEQLLYNPEDDTFIYLDSEDYMILDDDTQANLVWLVFDETTGEWCE